MDDAASASGAPPGTTSDVDWLHELGYAQELKRGMSGFSNFAVSFTIISIPSGRLTLFGYGMTQGGPAASAVWLACRGLLRHVRRSRNGGGVLELPDCRRSLLLVGQLAKQNGPAWAWFTGWFNLFGQVAITAGIDFGLTAFVCGFMNIGFDVVVTKLIVIITYTCRLAVHGLLTRSAFVW